MDIQLTAADRQKLNGEQGGAQQLAMRLIVQLAQMLDAPALIDVTAAHIDSCLYHGPVGLDFAERLVALGGRVTVPTTLNVSSLDLLHPELFRGDDETRRLARRLMDAYVALGCRPTWTCAPYQLRQRPTFGQQIAWAESNAIVFANSVLGARSNRYGDFIDICAALTGRVPDAGLHRSENRRGEILFRLVDVDTRLQQQTHFFALLGHVVGHETGNRIPVIDGVAAATEDQLKALGAAAASSGAVALFHVVGVTPEAPTLAAALHDQPPLRQIDVSSDMLRQARDELTTGAGGKLRAVSLGTPHFSLVEFEQLRLELGERTLDPAVDFYVSTGRDVLRELRTRGWLPRLEAAGVQIVVDTCTYITPILKPGEGVVMTNSGKWAYYAPGNIGVDVVFAGLRECVISAEKGEVWRDDQLW